MPIFYDVKKHLVGKCHEASGFGFTSNCSFISKILGYIPRRLLKTLNQHGFFFIRIFLSRSTHYNKGLIIENNRNSLGSLVLLGLVTS